MASAQALSEFGPEPVMGTLSHTAAAHGPEVPDQGQADWARRAWHPNAIGLGILRVRHALPGRIRVRVTTRPSHEWHAVEERVRRLSGVKSVRANSLTGSVLIHFDPRVTDEITLLAVLSAFASGSAGGVGLVPIAGPDGSGRATDLRPGLVPFTPLPVIDEQPVRMSEWLRTGTLPTRAPESVPWLPNAISTGGVVVGVGLLAARHLTAWSGPPLVLRSLGAAARLIHWLQHIPGVRPTLCALLGRGPVDFLFQVADTFLNALTASPIELVVAAIHVGAQLLNALQRIA